MSHAAVLLCGLSLVAAQPDGDLQIINPRATYGYLGAPRLKKDGLLPGDVAHFTFEVKNLKIGPDGNAAYSLAVEVLDPQGKRRYYQPPFNAVARSLFGGSTLPCTAHLEIPLDAKPGEYVLRVTFKDRLAGKEIVVERQGKVRAANFGIVRVGTFAEAEAKVPMPAVSVLGSTMFVNFSLVGFGRSKDKKQPDVEVSLKILDDKGKPTMAKPLTGQVQDVPEDLPLVPVQFGLTLSRVGRFTLELSAHDRLSGKSDTVSFPIQILGLE